jgi:very-short-patch-repair endonuclease
VDDQQRRNIKRLFAGVALGCDTSPFIGRGITAFRPQHPIGPYIIDFFCLKARLVVELDGGWHNENVKRIADEHRSDYLEGRGYTVLRFWNNEVTEDLSGVLQRIAEHLL